MIDQVADGLDGTVCYLDDLLVTANSSDQLVDRMDKVLGRLKVDRIRLMKRSKCVSDARKVSHLGWKISATEPTPLDDKISAASEAPETKNVGEQVSYYQRLLQGLATACAAVRVTQEGSALAVDGRLFGGGDPGVLRGAGEVWSHSASEARHRRYL